MERHGLEYLRGGSPGVGGTGGNGGQWNTASGGGGGGGYFGGGGGGNDGCCTGANAGAGGGGGSSLWPVASVGCTPGTNSGPGFVTIISPGCAESTICNGDTATLDFTGFFPAGATNFTVNPATDTYQPTPGNPNISFFPPDSMLYQVTAQTTSGPMTIDWPVKVYQPITPNAGLDDSLCFDVANGYMLQGVLHNNGPMYWEFQSAVTWTGGPGNAVFTPANDQPVTTINVNLGGEYLMVIHEEDTNGVCPEGLDTVAIYFSEEHHTTTFTDPICFEAPDGTIDIVTDVSPASGNMGANQYSVDGGVTWQPSPNFTGLTGDLPPGQTYTVMSMDYLGCTYTSTVTLTDPDRILMTLVSSDTTICQNGTATLVAQGTLAPVGSNYTYYWGASADNTNSTVITPSPAGTDFSSTVYCITDEGCYSDTLTLNVTHHPPILLDITANDSVCPGYDASHTVTAVGGFLDQNPDYYYSWTANGAAMANTGSTININPTVNTTYCVTVSDACETTPETICSDVIMRRVPDPMFTSDITWGCNPSTVNFMNTTDPQDVDSITWLINGVYYFNQDPLPVTFTQIGTYDVWLEVYSQYGCHDAINVPEYITIYDKPEPMFYINPNPTTMFNTGVEMNNVTPGANNTYQWLMPGGSPTTSGVESPSVYYPEGVVGEYPITLIATNQWGCVDSITAVLDVVSDVIIYAPNIFTPDGDEFNETWRVYIDGIDIYDFHITMYNRWGEPVWESFNQIAEWKGTYGNSGLVDDGVYVWKIECREQNTDKKYEFRGHVTVLK